MADLDNKNGSDERGFLHDVATPLGTAIFLIDMILEDAAKRGAGTEELLQLGQVFESLEKIKSMLEARREILIKRGVPSSRQTPG